MGRTRSIITPDAAGRFSCHRRCVSIRFNSIQFAARGSNENTFFQSCLMLTTVQPLRLAAISEALSGSEYWNTS